MTRGLLQRTLESEGFRVVAVESARRAIREFDTIDPDVVVIDIELGERPNGIDLAVILHSQAPYLGVVFLSNYPAVKSAESSFGPPPGSVFVAKGVIEGPGPIVEAIESVLGDRSTRLDLTVIPSDHPLQKLSALQLAVLRLVAEGWSNAEIAERRGITIRSTERLVSRTFAALGIPDDSSVNARVAATRMYIRVFGVPEPAASKS